MSAWLTVQTTEHEGTLEERTFYELFGGRLREVRAREGVTQADLADAIGMSRTSITNMERGSQPIHLLTLYRVAGALQVDVGELLPDVDLGSPEVDVDMWPDQIRDFIHRHAPERVS